MNVTWNPDTERVEWAPYRGDYGAHYSPDGPHCTAREDPATEGIAHLFEFEETRPQTYPCAQPSGDCGCTGTGLLGCPGRSVEES